MTKLTVIGCGYLGAVHAACMAQLGHDVVGIDVDAAKVELLSAGPDAVLRARIRGGAAGRAGHRPAVVHLGHGRRPRARRCTSSASAPRRSATSTPPTWRYVDAAVTALAPHLSAGDLVVGKSTVPVGTAAPAGRAWSPSAEPAALLAWNPEFLREGFAVAGHPAPRSAGLRPARRRGRRAWPDALLDEVYATPLADGRAAGGHRLRDRRAGQGRGELLPGHQDLLHQRDGRGLRGQRRRRRPARRRDRPRRPHRPAIPQRRPRASAAAACPRTSGRSWPGPANWAPTRRWPSCGRSTPSTCAAGSGWSTWPARSAAARSSAGGSPCSGWRSSRTATTSATPRR